MITLKNLLINTPLAQITKDKLLADLPTMQDQIKFDLEMLCWRTLSETIELKYLKEKAKILQEVSEGKRKYNPNDYSEAKVKLYHSLAASLDHAESDQQIEEVRTLLEKHKSKPSPKIN